MHVAHVHQATAWNGRELVHRAEFRGRRDDLDAALLDRRLRPVANSHTVVVPDTGRRARCPTRNAPRRCAQGWAAAASRLMLDRTRAAAVCKKAMFGATAAELFVGTDRIRAFTGDHPEVSPAPVRDRLPADGRPYDRGTGVRLSGSHRVVAARWP